MSVMRRATVAVITCNHFAPNITHVRSVWNRPKGIRAELKIRPKWTNGNVSVSRGRVHLESNHKCGNYVGGRLEEVSQKIYPKTVSKLPKALRTFDEEFDKVTGFQDQLTSLQLRGFQRGGFRPFIPPKDMETRFMDICSRFLPGGLQGKHDMSQVTLMGPEKASLLGALAESFGGHRVPNSLLHTMTTLDRVFTFYSTQVNQMSPYDRLEAGVRQGVLPQNLHVQLEPVRFDPSIATSDMGRISAFPRCSTILVSPEAQKKWKPFKAKHSPYKNSKSDD